MCGPHEVWNDCGPHNYCVRTCANLGDMLLCPPTCVEGCFCEDGFARNSDGNCVLADACPIKL